MEAKSFRIGNLLRSKQWYGVASIEGIEVLADSWELKVKGYVHKWEIGKYFDLEPIPITEEWLIKLGFDRAFNKFTGEHSHLPSHYHLNGFKIDVEYYYGSVEVCHYEFSLHPNTELRYVHQLQNLFFALTGIELELKEDKS